MVPTNISTEMLISTVGAAISGFGLLFLAIQLVFQARLTKAQFVSSLSADVERNIELEVRLEPDGSLYDPVPSLSETDRQKIVLFLTFFDRLHHLLNVKVISLQVADVMFAYRFFILVHNPNVQKYELLGEKTRHYWRSVFALHKQWYAYRLGKHMPILRPEGVADLKGDRVYAAS